MPLNESIVEDAALEWFLLRPIRQAQGYGGQVGDQPSPRLRRTRRRTARRSAFAKPSITPGEYAGGTLTPAPSHGEREEDCDLLLVGRLREAIRRPAVAGLPKLLSGELSVAVEDKPLEDAA